MGLAHVFKRGRWETLVWLRVSLEVWGPRASELKSPISRAPLSLTKLYSSESFNAQVDKGITWVTGVDQAFSLQAFLKPHAESSSTSLPLFFFSSLSASLFLSSTTSVLSPSASISSEPAASVHTVIALHCVRLLLIHYLYVCWCYSTRVFWVCVLS